MTSPWRTAVLVAAGLLCLATVPTLAADALLFGRAAWLGPAGFVLLGTGLLLAAVPRSPARGSRRECPHHLTSTRAGAQYLARRGWSR